jgi:hypothetical protein
MSNDFYLPSLRLEEEGGWEGGGVQHPEHKARPSYVSFPSQSFFSYVNYLFPVLRLRRLPGTETSAASRSPS